MADKVMIDHGDRVLVASESAGGVSLRLFTPLGFSEFDVQVEEAGPLIALFKSVVVADAETRLKGGVEHA